MLYLYLTKLLNPIQLRDGFMYAYIDGWVNV